MDLNAEEGDPEWEAAFLLELRRALAAIQARGGVAVEVAGITAGEVITVLRVDGTPAGSGDANSLEPTTLRGRVQSLSWLRSRISPRWPSFVAEAWVEDLYPPHHPDPTTVVDGVHWFRGRTPGMSQDQINQLAPAPSPPPPPRWLDDLPPGVRPENVRFSAGYSPLIRPQDPPPTPT